MTKLQKNQVKIEDLEQYDYYDSDYIETRRKVITPLIGEYFIAFSQFEHDINTTLSEMINDRTHEIGYVILRDMRMMQKVTVLSDLMCQWLSATGSKRINKLMSLNKKMVDIVNFRNDIAHANWNTLEKKDFVRIKIRPSKDTGYITFKKGLMSPKVIKTYIKMINTVCEDLYEFIEKEHINFS